MACDTCGGRHPVARVSRRLEDGRLAVICPVCRTGSVVDFLGTRPLPECGHTVEIVNRAAGPVTRTRRARRRGTCPLCRRPVTVGQSIACLPDRLTGQRWVHVHCIPVVVAARRRAVPDIDDRNPIL